MDLGDGLCQEGHFRGLGSSLPLVSDDLGVFLKTEFVSFRGLPSVFSPSRNGEVLLWSETGCISWPHCPHTGCLNLSPTRACVVVVVLSCHARSWRATAPGCDQRYRGTEFLLCLGLKRGHVFKWSPSLEQFWVEKQFCQGSVWSLPLDGLLCMWSKGFSASPM